MTVNSKVGANGRVSFWYEAIGGVPAYRPPLPGDRSADICIVGGGFTGLWTAYYLKEADPSLDIVVIEREFAGFGASGRNGGWASGLIAGSRERFAALYGEDAVRRQQRVMSESVDELIRVADAEGIRADILKSGTVRIASTPGQVSRLRERVAADHHWGVDDTRMLEPEELSARIRTGDALAACFTPHCARIQPAKLVRQLADVGERRGVPIYEGTAASRLGQGVVHTNRGVVRAPVILRATEGFTASLAGQGRTWLPMNSSMIVTEQLPDAMWDEIGWAGAETLGDTAYSHMYAQRTADGRIALGGRGVPYRFHSHTDDAGRTQPKAISELEQVLHARFPLTREARIQHAWCGVLGVPRDWCSSAVFDEKTGLGWAGGYVGQGVTTTNLAGRTLRDLVLRRQTELASLPWVGHTSRRWEVEPVRWIGVRSMYAAYRHADHKESKVTGQGSRLAHVADLISKRP
jgi:glycine/D-amino acid oxidase-like deaminating enzyme